MSREIGTITALITGAVLCTGTCVQASISLVSQSRSVATSAALPPITDSHSDSAPDFSPWTRTVSSTAGTGNPGATASASQNSSISTSTISAVMQMSAQRLGTNSTGSASSMLNVVFDVLDTPAPYSIIFSSAIAGDNSGAAASADLTGPSGSVFSWSRHIFNNSWPTSPRSGTLPVGRYTLGLSVGSSTGFGDQIGPSGSINWNMSIPAPGAAVAFTCAGLFAARRRRGS